MSQFTSLTIKNIIRETPSAVSLVFDIPTEKRNDFNFVAGQFLHIQISVKKIAKGQFSTYANEQLKIGDVIEAMIPEGKFQLQPNTKSDKNYMAFAAGSGITPIMSIIKIPRKLCFLKNY